jgi:hypothetical protein
VTTPGSRADTLARCVRGFAAFDLVVTGCLAVPPLAPFFLELLFVGAAPRVRFEPLHLLFVNLAGVLGVLWAIARLRAPTPELALLDVAGRFAVAALILRATAEGGMTPILHFFVATEVVGAFVQYWAVRRARPEQAT